MTQTRNYPLTFEVRRSDVSGEFPLYQPQTIGDVDQLARQVLEATLVHAFPLPPLDSLPEEVRRPAPSVHPGTLPVLELPYPPKPPGYLGVHRHPDDVPPPVKPRKAVPGWLSAVLSFAGGVVGGVAVVVVAVFLAGGPR